MSKTNPQNGQPCAQIDAGRAEPFTKVIFRVFPEGDVIALFPAQAGSVGDPWTCMSYQHQGQHGAASVDLSRTCRLAKPREYRPLAKELRRLGYRLDIRQRMSRADLKARQEQLSK